MDHADAFDDPRSSAPTSTRVRADDALDRSPTLGPYRLLSVLGRGGMATVYRARDDRLGREVAIKLLLPHLRRDRTALRRFVQEARAVAKLRHEGIVGIFDVASEDAPEPFLVVELVRGGSLRDVLRGAPPMVPEVGAALAIEVLDALEHAHGAGIVHRDIKPENVLIDEGEREASAARPKLADFGIAKMAGQQTVTNTGDLVGSPAYMAPEQLEGAPSDARADIFAVGVMLYECITGSRPFEGDGAAQVIRRIVAGHFVPADQRLPTVGARWAQIVARAIAYDRDARFPSARAMADALRAELARTTLAVPCSFADWLRAPGETNAAIAEALVPGLLAHAKQALVSRDALALAADVNRLLALAPGHPEALSLLMHRARADRRRRVLARALVAFSTIAFVAATALVARRFRRENAPVAEVDRLAQTAIAAPVPALDAGAPTTESLREKDREPTLRAELVDASVTKSPATKGAGSELQREAARAALVGRARDALRGSRSVFIDALQPPFGVLVRIDDGEGNAIAEGGSIQVPAGRHVLRFACKGDACIPQEIVLASGDTDAHLQVTMRIRPARLRILSAPDRRFQLLELPAVELRLGEDNEVPMRGSRASLHVVDVSSGRKTPVALTAGVVTTISPE